MKNNLYSLKKIYELRKTTSLCAKFSLGRLFWFNNMFGICDDSCALWPIKLHNIEAKTNDIIMFEAIFIKKDYINISKYEDNIFMLQITKVLEKVVSLEKWNSPYILEPNILIKNTFIKHYIYEYTSFFPSTFSDRLKKIIVRNNVVQKVRDYFNNRAFIYMETPTLVPSGGVEAYLHTFQTSYIDYKGIKWKLNLPTSPEFALKKLICEGFSKIYQISRAYRNGGELSKWHEPEFLMLEWYRIGADLFDIMTDTKNLILYLQEHLMCENKIDIPKDWRVFKVNDLFIEHCNINLENVQDVKDFIKIAQTKSLSVHNNDDWDSVFYKLFFEKIEPFLVMQKACFITEYPKQMGALAKFTKNNHLFVQRFEAYLQGIEICNGYYELNDSEELSLRFDNIQNNRTTEIDRDVIFENCMKFGLAPCSGNALGLDRVIAILCGLNNISELYAIPFLSQFLHNTVANE